jgi:hypothetical protein
MPSTVVSFTPTNTAPNAITGPSFTGTGAVPTGITPPSFAGTGASPTGIALAPLAGTGESPAAHALAMATTPTANVPQLVAYSPNLAPPTDDTMLTPALLFAGQLTAAQLFGFYKPATVVAVLGVQLNAQVAPVGADVIIELVDSDGTGLGRTATLPAGEAFAAVTFGTPLPLAANTLLRGKVTQVGSSTPGSFLTANLIVQVVP